MQRYSGVRGGDGGGSGEIPVRAADIEDFASHAAPGSGAGGGGGGVGGGKSGNSLRLIPGEGVWFDLVEEEEEAAEESEAAAAAAAAGAGARGGVTKPKAARAVRVTGPGGAPVRWLCPGAMEAAAAVIAVGLCTLNQVDP
jgi:hypothetical protein